MYRSRRVTNVRLALSATLLGWAALAHATTQKSGEDAQWTRVDLDNAPALVIGVAAGAKNPESAKAPTAKSANATKQGSAGKPGTTTSAKVSPQSPRLEPAQAPKPEEVRSQSVEPAQPSIKVMPAMTEESTTSAKAVKDVSPAASTAVNAPASPVSGLAALLAPVVQLLPKAVVEPAQPAQPVLVEPAQSTKTLSVEPAQPGKTLSIEPAQPGKTLSIEPAQLSTSSKPLEPALEPKKPNPVAAVPKTPLTYALSPKDKTIRAGLERWTANSGWKLSWELDEKFQNGGVVRFDADFGADFDVALSKLAGAMRSEVKTHVYLYVGNKVLRVMEEPAKPVVQQAVPMTPAVPDGAQKDAGDRGLPYITRVKGYWLGASGTDSEDAPPTSLPPVFNASVSLLFSDKASLGTVTGILSKVTGIAILLPGAIEYPASSLFVNDAPAPDKKKASRTKAKLTYVGTPRALLDRISVSTGLLWEYKDETVVFTE